MCVYFPGKSSNYGPQKLRNVPLAQKRCPPEQTCRWRAYIPTMGPGECSVSLMMKLQNISCGDGHDQIPPQQLSLCDTIKTPSWRRADRGSVGMPLAMDCRQESIRCFELRKHAYFENNPGTKVCKGHLFDSCGVSESHGCLSNKPPVLYHLRSLFQNPKRVHHQRRGHFAAHRCGRRHLWAWSPARGNNSHFMKLLQPNMRSYIPFKAVMLAILKLFQALPSSMILLLLLW